MILGYDFIEEEVQIWQNVIFAAKVFLLELRFPTLTGVQTGPGNRISSA